MGVEFGDDFVFDSIVKGDIYVGMVVVLNNLGEVGIKCLVMIINGVGGKYYSE